MSVKPRRSSSARLDGARDPLEQHPLVEDTVLRTQIGKLLDVHPDLGRHLRDTVRMGTR